MAPDYRFGRFELHAGTRELLVDGRSAPLGARAFDVLLALIERRERLVTKDELLNLAWPGLVVEENNLQVQISSLRKILGDGIIKTVPGHGYRFTVEASSESPFGRRRHNLPQSLTRFIGHDTDLSEYEKIVVGSRLVTLTGSGGCGKTRLAVELASRLLPNFAGGAWFVDLAPMSDPEQLPSTVVRTLGLKERPGQPTMETLCQHVGDRPMLFVLDNCEHLVSACAALVTTLLARLGHLHVLATSREVMGVPGEQTLRVRSLLYPPAEHRDQEADGLTRFEAVQLFVDRAHLVQPEFVLDRTSAPAVGEICRRLDGIPLAIELAAARTSAISPQELRDRLQDRFRLLVTSGKAALPRQQTLLAAVQWSYDLLTGEEARLLQQLSVFAGGWTLEAATAIAGADAYAVLDRLTALVDKSLVVAQPAEGAQTRYSLLETVRQYAERRLVESGEEAAVRTRHTVLFLALAEEALTGLNGPDQRSWFARLDPERENFIAAHQWCGRTESGAELSLRLVYALRGYWMHRGGLELGYRLAVGALARTRQRSLVRCLALGSAANLGQCMGIQREVRRYTEEALSIAREIGSDKQVTLSLLALGEHCYVDGHRPEARRHIEEALPIARRLDDATTLNSALLNLAELNRLEGDLTAAESLYLESLALARAAGELRNIVKNLLNLASVSIARGFGEHVPGMLLEALNLVQQVGSKPLGANVLLIAAAQAVKSGEWRRAGQLYGAGDAQCQEIGFQREPADEAFLSPLIAKAREAFGSSAFAAAEVAGRSLSYEAALAEARAWLAQAAV